MVQAAGPVEAAVSVFGELDVVGGGFDEDVLGEACESGSADYETATSSV